MFKKYIFLIFSLTYLPSFAQHEFSSFSATGRAGVSTTMLTDYQSIGVNPANLSFEGRFKEKTVTLGFAELGMSVHSRALTRSELSQSLFTFNSEEFSLQEKLTAALKFGNNPLAINADAGIFGLSIQIPKVGGFGLAVRERVQWYSVFSPRMSDILFSGYNSSYFDSLVLENGNTIANSANLNDSTRDQVVRGISNIPASLASLIDGSKVDFSWIREYNLSYGTKIIETDKLSLHIGLGVKYIQGFAGMRIEGNSSATNQGYVSLSPIFDVDFGAAAANNPNKRTGNGLQATGSGLGVDLGVNLVVDEKIKLGAAVTNIGSMTWNYDVYSLQSALVSDLTSGGFDNYNIFLEAQEFTGDNGFFNWQAEAKTTVALPTLARVGGSIVLGELAEIGADIVVPVNNTLGNLESAIYAVGGDLYALPWIRLSAGFSYGGNIDRRLNLPLGVTFIAGDQGSYEAGIASRDALTYFLQDGPTLSFAMGFLRFRI